MFSISPISLVTYIQQCELFYSFILKYRCQFGYKGKTCKDVSSVTSPLARHGTMSPYVWKKIGLVLCMNAVLNISTLTTYNQINSLYLSSPSIYYLLLCTSYRLQERSGMITSTALSLHVLN